MVVGEHVEAAELAEQYDAVIYAVGTQSDRALNIPGENLSAASPPSISWAGTTRTRNFEEKTPDLSGARAVVVGNGNVALDVARILVTDPDVLALTDIADHALESLRPCGVDEVVIIGRRGPLQTAFTTLELRELGDLEGVDVIVDPAQLEGITDEEAEAAGKVSKQNIKVLRGYAEREPRPGHRRIVFRFLTSPIEIKGDGKVEHDRAGPQRTGHRRERAGIGQGHRRARGATGSAGGALGRLPRCAHPGAAVRRQERDHSATPTAGWKAAATNTSSVGSSAGRPV